jgi:hypothetical protein
MRNTVRVVSLVKGDGCLGPSKSHRDAEGTHSVHLLLGDVVLPVGPICLGAPKDHEASLGLEELDVILLGTIRGFIGL